MKALLKNLVASAPIGLAYLVALTTKPALYVSQKLTLLAIYLHETFETDLGKNITAKKAEIKKAVEMMTMLKQKMEQAQASGEPSDDILANIVKGNKASDLPENVIVLGKKDDSNKT